MNITNLDRVNFILSMRRVRARSAWERGVIEYAEDLAEQLKERINDEQREPASPEECNTWLLNGAYNWNEFSWGGCSLFYNGDIAKRLCTPSELKKTRTGERKPNANEEWLDVQARALHQAARIINGQFAVSAQGNN